MGRKIFVSYKYRDANVYPLNWFGETTVRSYVDKLEEYFDSSDNIYKGESDNEDLSQYSENTIWEKLKDRIYDSSVTIVMISPNMKETHRYDRTQWIPWEISYSLKSMSRNDRISRSNAVLAVVLPDLNNSYDYFIKDYQCFNCSCRVLMIESLFKILSNNMFNLKIKTKFNCTSGLNSNIYTGKPSYIASVKWQDFIISAKNYIDSAIELKDQIDYYEICKEV